MASITSAFQGRIMDCFRSFLLGKHVHMSAQICFIMSTISYSCVARGMQIEICKFCARSAIKRKRAWIYQLIIALINIGGGGYNLCNPVVRDYPPRQIFTSAKLKKNALRWWACCRYRDSNNVLPVCIHQLHH